MPDAHLGVHVVAPLLELARPVDDGDFARTVLLNCGRCRDDELLIGGHDALHRQPKPLVSPTQPTTAEMALHEVTHLPYAPWCPYCVAGRRPNAPHSPAKNPTALPMLCSDYAFFGDQGEPLVTFIVAYIRPVWVYFASVVDAKGPTAFALRMLSDGITPCGLARFAYRADRAAALKSLIETSVRESDRDDPPLAGTLADNEDVDEPEVREIGGESALQPPPAPNPTKVAVPEHSHVGESQSNCASERAVQLVEDMARALKAVLEDRVSWIIPSSHAVMQWMIRHAAYLLTKHRVGADHCTGHKRLHGKGSRERMADFGERVLYR